MEHAMLRTIIITLSLITLPLNIASAAVYKWVDDKGNVHYSEQRPKDNQAEKIRVNSTPPASSSSYKKPSLKTTEDDKAKGDKGKAANADNGVDAKQKQEMCARARKDLETLLSSGRVRVKDNEGNVNYMTSEEKEERIKRNQERIKEVCQ